MDEFRRSELDLPDPEPTKAWSEVLQVRLETFRLITEYPCFVRESRRGVRVVQ